MNPLELYKYYQSTTFFEFLVTYLSEKIVNTSLIESFSQNKEELIFNFSEIFIQADLNPQIGLLGFPLQYARARRNSINLFQDIENQYVKNINYHKGERSFDVTFGNDFVLFFKMHGRNSNILLFNSDEELVEIFRNNIENDKNIKLKDFVRIPPSKLAKPEPDFITNAHKFYVQFSSKYYFDSEKVEIQRFLNEKLKQTQKYLEKTTQKLNELIAQNQHQKWGDILMANLHNPIQNLEKAVFYDFYENKEVTIRLKKELTLQKNAENYYRKAKNEKLEIEKLKQNIGKKENLFLDLKSKLEALQAFVDLKSIRNFAKEIGFHQKEEEKQSLPFREIIFEGWKIWIGKSATQNDELTLKYGFKEDLWFHAKDVSGSHVLLKYQSGKKFPKNVIEEAAKWATFYSKAKTEKLASVAYTLSKYVKKPKGFAPGAVKTEKETVILVEPKTSSLIS